MKLDSILELWEEDSKLDRNDLSNESLKIPGLHSKYYRIYVNEKLILRKYEAQLKELKMEKYEFYTQGPSKEQIDRGWKLPPVGKVLKADVNMYLDADKEIIELSLRIGIQKEKIDLLESIIESFKARGFNIKSALDFERFKMGI